MKKYLLILFLILILPNKTHAEDININISTNKGEVNLAADTATFSENQPLELKATKNYANGVKGIYQRVNSTINSSPITLATEIIDSSGRAVIKQETEITEDRLNPNISKLKPGKYTLKIQDYTQDFYWGVLVVNPNKNVYTPNETAELALAVLDDTGAMVCNAEVEVNITDPTGKTTVLDTNNHEIITNPECQMKTLTTKPDYETTYKTSIPGIYNMTIKAVTENGEYVIKDYFEVKDTVSLDIERITATRIYPPLDYPVIIKIKANEDYTGKISEVAPAEFDLFSISDKKIQEYASSKLDGSEIIINKPNLVKNNDKIYLNWNVNFKAGETYVLAYQYNSPNKSPNLYTLGPLETEKTSETRKWLIAVDDVVIDSSTYEVRYQRTPGPQVVFINDTTGYVFYQDEAASASDVEVVYRKNYR